MGRRAMWRASVIWISLNLSSFSCGSGSTPNTSVPSHYHTTVGVLATQEMLVWLTDLRCSQSQERKVIYFMFHCILSCLNRFS